MSVALFIEIAFELVGLEWREYVVSDKGLRRPTDLEVNYILMFCHSSAIAKRLMCLILVVAIIQSCPGY